MANAGCLWLMILFFGSSRLIRVAGSVRPVGLGQTGAECSSNLLDDCCAHPRWVPASQPRLFFRRKGLHGSMYFTLGLPVGRFRLFAVRVGVGILETLALTLVEFCTAGNPDSRQQRVGSGRRTSCCCHASALHHRILRAVDIVLDIS